MTMPKSQLPKRFTISHAAEDCEVQRKLADLLRAAGDEPR